ncbi:MAG TPA: Hsp70 family protein [Solirubrobacteraceae bacterium]|nr:Hsp70 family protein [Solirubrobacteraceae bacterium]
MSAVGIDFGTTNSAVAVYGAGGGDVLAIDQPPPTWEPLGLDKVLPSVVGIGEGDQATFGWAAKTRSANKLEAVKRLFATEESVRIGGVEYSVEMVAALLFARLKQGAESVGVPVDRAVVTIPANSRGLARFRTKLCASLAGIDVRALINEPTAAAMAHSISASEDSNILVFDWGGGTLDVTVLETVAGVFMERASKGIQRSGGLDLDNLFASAVLEQVSGTEQWREGQMAAFRLGIEQAKIVLSTQASTHVELPDGTVLSLTREMLERAIRGKIEETRGPIDQCLRDLGIGADAIDHLVLVGGSSKIPALRQFVSEILNKDPLAGADPMTAVAEGASIAGAILSGELDADFFVATEHALGTISFDDREKPEFSVLIGRNHQLPAKETSSYRPLHEGQKSVEVQVIEGDPNVPLDHPDNVILKRWDVDIDPTRPLNESGFTMVYEYDVDGILHVRVIDEKTGATMLKDDVSFGVSRDKAGLVTLAQSVSATISGQPLGPGAGAGPSHDAAEQQPGLDHESLALLDRVRTKIIPFIDEQETEKLESMCQELEGAIGGVVLETCRSALESAARKYAYLF